MDWSNELREALAAAEIAGEYVLGEYDLFAKIPNAPASISTHVDRGAQELILKYLRSKFPDDGVIAEEKTESIDGAPVSRRTWIVDPIDGTRGFAMKTGEFSVMIALAFDHRPVVGVVLEPVIKRITYASEGGGCWTRTGLECSPHAPREVLKLHAERGDYTRCRVSDCETMSKSALVISHLKPGKPPKPLFQKLAPARMVETYSAGIKLGMVARGEVELYVNDYAGFHDWDIAPGHLLVTEAGGQVTDFDGGEIRYGTDEGSNRKGMLGSNGKVHAEALRIVAS